jgi:uncharacterized membrane protein
MKDLIVHIVVGMIVVPIAIAVAGLVFFWPLFFWETSVWNFVYAFSILGGMIGAVSYFEENN